MGADCRGHTNCISAGSLGALPSSKLLEIDARSVSVLAGDDAGAFQGWRQQIFHYLFEIPDPSNGRADHALADSNPKVALPPS